MSWKGRGCIQLLFGCVWVMSPTSILWDMKQWSSTTLKIGSLEAWNYGPNHSVVLINLGWYFLIKRDKRPTVRMSLSEGNWTLIRPLTENCPPIKGMTGFKFSKQHFPKTRSWMEETKEPTRLLHLAVFWSQLGTAFTWWRDERGWPRHDFCGLRLHGEGH